VSGTIDVRGQSGELNAEAIDGDIHVIALLHARAKTATGTITFQGASFRRRALHGEWTIKVDGGVFERTKIETVTGNITFRRQAR